MKNIFFYFKKDLANHIRTIKVNGDEVDFNSEDTKLLVDVPLFRINNEVEVEAVSGYVFREKFSFRYNDMKRVEIVENPFNTPYIWRVILYILGLSISAALVYYNTESLIKSIFGILFLAFAFFTFPKRTEKVPFLVKVSRK